MHQELYILLFRQIIDINEIESENIVLDEKS